MRTQGMFVALATALLLGGAQEVEAKEQAVVTASVLRLRSRPSLRARIIGRVKRGTKVEVLAKSRRTAWWRVQVRGRKGFMWSGYLRSLPSKVAQTPKQKREGAKAKSPRAKPRAKSKQAEGAREKSGSSTRKGSSGRSSPGAGERVTDRPRTTRKSGDWEPVVRIGTRARVSQRAINVLKRILKSANVRSALITSGRRTPADQARAMYQLLSSRGSAYGYRLYGAHGDRVIDVYVRGRRAGKSSAQVQREMASKITAIGPSRVSKHCRASGDVIDVAPSSISNRAAFAAALRRARSSGLVSKVIFPPGDPAYHIEMN